MISTENSGLHSVDDFEQDRRTQTRRSEDYFWLQRVAAITGDGCLVVNSDRGIEFADETLFTRLEIDPASLGAEADFDTLTLAMAQQGSFGPGDPQTFVALMSDMMTNQKLKQSNDTQTVVGITPSGRHIVISITYGRDDRFIILVRDKTDELIEEQALEMALDVGTAGYWHHDLETKDYVVRADFLKKLLEPSVYERLDKDGPHILLHPEDVDAARQLFRDCIVEQTRMVGTYRLLDKDNQTHWVKSHIVPRIDETGRTRQIVCFMRDVTSQLRVQDDLRAAQEQAERALKAKNSFLSRLSHEVRTPMNAVIGLADAIIHHHDDPAINPKLTLIQDSAEKIVRLVDETLQHAKLEEEQIELNPREASPKRLVRNVCALWEDKASKVGTALTCAVAPDVPKTIMFDDFRYEQCLNNLVSNAVKFTEGGKIQVVLTVTGSERNRQLVLAVRDTGIGMSQEQMKQVFLPFKQADKSITARYGGTGLGMAITKDLIELMGGRISVKSEPGKGSLFVLSIPVVMPEADAIGSDSLVGNILGDTESDNSDYSSLDILIVDDNATNHMVMGSLLGSIVGNIDTALNGEEAIEALKAKTYDVVLMDIHMPVMDGIEATLAIRSSDTPYTDVPIIALTADPQYQQSRLCKNIGMDEALAKPVRLTNLLQAFDQVLGPTLDMRRTPVSRSAA